MSPLQRKLLATTFLIAGLSFSPLDANAEDCVSDLPDTTCTITEDTTAPLIMDNGVQLVIDGSITIGHTINGSAASDDGLGEVISNDASTNVITQNADIGNINPILSLSIGDNDTWNSYAAIITGETADSIDLGATDGGETLNFYAGSSYVGEINGHEDDVVNFGEDGAGGNFITGGQIESVQVNVVSGQLTAQDSMGSGIGLDELNINDGATLIADANIVIDTGSTLTMDGLLWVMPGASVTTDFYGANADAGTLRIGVERLTNGDPEAGIFSVSDGGPIDFSNDTIEIYIEDTSQVLETGLIEDVILGNGGEPIAPALFRDNSFLYDFELVSDGGDNYDLTITRNEVEDIASSVNNLSVATVIIDGRTLSTDGAINDIQTSLGRAASSEEFNENLEALQPAIDGGYVMASVQSVDQALGITQSRMNSLRNGGIATGISSGEVYKGLSVWGQGFGATGEQDTRDGIDGYEVSTYGGAVGVDTNGKESNWVLGVGASYAVSDVTSKDANETETEIVTYQMSLYGDYELEDKSFFSGMIAYALNDNDIERRAVGGVTRLNAQADFQSEQITVRGEYGRPLIFDNGIAITPKLQSNYAFIEAEDYTERNAGGANLFVDTNEMHIVEVGTAVEFSYEQKYRDGSYFRPGVELGYMYDANNAKMRSVASFVDGGDSFEVEGYSRQKHTVDMNAGFTYGTDVWELMANYNYTYKGDFTSHAGTMRAAYKF